MSAGICRAGWMLFGWLMIDLAIGAEKEDAAPPAAAQGEATEATMALWKQHELDFTYRSAVPTHTCHDLRHRVAAILVAVGARPDIEVEADDCDIVLEPDQTMRGGLHEPWEPRGRFETGRYDTDRFHRSRSFERLDRGQSTRVRIRLWSPVEATDAAMEEWKKSKSRSELVARVTGNPAPVMQMTGQFPAEWQTVTLTHRNADLEPEDCQLLEQMSSTVLRQLRVRKVRSSHCDTSVTSNLPPQLTAEALISNPFSGPVLRTSESAPQDEPAEGSSTTESANAPAATPPSQ
jgi:hypothetical protein